MVDALKKKQTITIIQGGGFKSHQGQRDFLYIL